MGLFDFLKKSTGDLPLGYDPNGVVEQLGELGYFKYAAAGDIPDIKRALVKSFTRQNGLNCIYFDESPFQSTDYRHYHFDGEDLFEGGGFLGQLQDMKALFDKMQFKLEISNHVEDWESDTGLNHVISLNGKEYIIFKDFAGVGWLEAAQRFAEIINDQLVLQHIDERIYLQNGGHDGQAVYLTEQQFAILDPILKGKDRPLKVEDWCEVYVAANGR